MLINVCINPKKLIIDHEYSCRLWVTLSLTLMLRHITNCETTARFTKSNEDNFTTLVRLRSESSLKWAIAIRRALWRRWFICIQLLSASASTLFHAGRNIRGIYIVLCIYVRYQLLYMCQKFWTFMWTKIKKNYFF